MIGIQTDPRQHQHDYFTRWKNEQACAVFSEMGTGKSLMCLMNAAYLYSVGKIKRVLVLAPKGCYRNWSDEEIPKHLRLDLPYKVAYWSSYSNREIKKQLEALEEPGEALRILVVNIEACASGRVLDFVEKFVRKQAAMMIVDESTTLKNPTAKRTKIVTNMGKFAEYRRICSGNPIPNGPLDLWSQAEFLKKDLLGYSNFFAFRNRFAVVQEQKFGNRSFKHVVGYRDMDELKRLMNRFSFIVKKEQCLDLPPKVYTMVDVEMGPKQAAAYATMAQDAYLQLTSASQVTAPMVITQMIRLHQISCGFLKPDYGEPVGFDEPSDRIDQLLDVLEQAPGKAIVWATYQYNIRQVIEAISKKFGPQSVVDFYGLTSPNDRQDAKKLFQDPKSEVKYIVSNPSSGKFGNTWTQGTTVVYFSNDWNLENRDQSEDRSHRLGTVGAVHSPGEDPSVLYVDLIVRGTIDERIFRALRKKRKLSDEIVQSNWGWLIAGKVA